MAHKVICMGRQFGSGGHELAVMAGERLGLRVYDSDILRLACAFGEVAVQRMEKADERTTNPLLFQGVYEGNHNIPRGEPTSEVLFALQSHEILRIAGSEDCIFVGRCADFVLRDADVQMLKVFVRAPFSFRVRRKMELEQLSAGRAALLVRRMDRRRRDYYEHYTGQTWGGGADLDLDMGRLTFEEAVRQIETEYTRLPLRQVPGRGIGHGPADR